MGVWQANGCMTQARRRALEPIDPTGRPCHACTAHTPSRRTLQRRHAERRWLTRPPWPDVYTAPTKPMRSLMSVTTSPDTARARSAPAESTDRRWAGSARSSR
jgi:hypothetical protein